MTARCELRVAVAPQRNYVGLVEKTTENLVACGMMEPVGGLIETIVHIGRTTGPSLRVGVTPDHRAAVVEVEMTDAGLDIDGITALIDALGDARTILILEAAARRRAGDDV